MLLFFFVSLPTGSSSLSYNTPSHTDPSPRLAAKEGRDTLFELFMFYILHMPSVHVCLSWCNCCMSGERVEWLDCLRWKEEWKMQTQCLSASDTQRACTHTHTHTHTHLRTQTAHTNPEHWLPATKLCAGAPFVSLKIIRAKRLLFRAATWTLWQHAVSSAGAASARRRISRKTKVACWWVLSTAAGERADGECDDCGGTKRDVRHVNEPVC